MYMCKCTLGVWHGVNLAHYHLSLSKCGNMIRSILTGEPNLELYFNYSFTATYNIYFFCLLPTTKNAMTCIILYAVYAYFMGICLTHNGGGLDLRLLVILYKITIAIFSFPEGL